MLAEPRPATLDDAAEIARLHRRCFGAEPWGRESIELMLAQPKTFGFLVERGATVGFCLARTAGDECEVLSLAVLPEHRRQSHGRRLVQAILAAARDRRCAAVFLEVGEANEAARRLYLDNGFAVVGRRKGYYRTAGGGAMDALVLRNGGTWRDAGASR